MVASSPSSSSLPPPPPLSLAHMTTHSGHSHPTDFRTATASFQRTACVSAPRGGPPMLYRYHNGPDWQTTKCKVSWPQESRFFGQKPYSRSKNSVFLPPVDLIFFSIMHPVFPYTPPPPFWLNFTLLLSIFLFSFFSRSHFPLFPPPSFSRKLHRQIIPYGCLGGGGYIASGI
jgi:hypothetical protein